MLPPLRFALSCFALFVCFCSRLRQRLRVCVRVRVRADARAAVRALCVRACGAVCVPPRHSTQATVCSE